MAQRIASDNIEAHIQGEIAGQVAVGKQIIQVHAEHGAIVNVSAEQTPQPRPTPILFLRPRRFHGLRDRQPEIEAIISALLADQAVELYGKAGVGKTTLLRHLAYHPDLDGFSDGIIYRSALHQPLADLFQFLFDAFYESDFHFKPTDTQVRHFLQGKRALVLLDDVKLSREEVEELILAVPSCAFVIASQERCLWMEMRSIALRGLPLDDAVALIEQEIARPLTLQEREAAQKLCANLDGHPLRILQEVVAARDEAQPLLAAVDRTLEELVRPGNVRAQIPASLPAHQQSLLATLAGLGGASVHARHLMALTGSSPADLEALEQRKLVKVEGSRYSLAGNLGDVLEQLWDLTKPRERALSYFIAWAEQHRQSPDILLEEADAIQQLLDWAGTVGRWPEAQRLGRAVEGALTLSGRWEAWKRVLQEVLQASRALKDRAGEGWALHQLGSRALGLTDANAAAAYLNQALGIRESLGDRIGAAVTRHNINVLLGLLPPQEHPPSQSSTGPSKGAAGASSAKSIPLALKLAIIPIVLIAGGIIFWYAITRMPTPNPSNTPNSSNSSNPSNSSNSSNPPNPSKSSNSSNPSNSSNSSDPNPSKPATPVVNLSATSLTFTDQEIGTSSKPQTVSITNQSPQSLAFNINVTGNQAGDFQPTDNCKNLPAGGSCTISVVFAPQAIGERNASLAITFTNGDKPLSVSLSGAAAAARVPVVRLSADSLQFEDQPPGSKSKPKAITLANVGQVPLNITDITMTGANRDDFIETTRCGQTIDINQSCTISIVFAPKSPGSLSAVLSINDNAAGSPQQVMLTGTSTAPKISFSLSPDAIDFGNQTGRKPKAVTITNSGPVPLRIGAITVTGTNPKDFQIRTGCSNSTLAPGSVCDVDVFFIPQALGKRIASLNVTVQAADNSHEIPSMNSVPLSGIAADPKSFDFTVNPPNVDLSNCKPGAPCVRDFSITNTGSMPMNIEQITFSGMQEDEYKIHINCPNRTIPPGGTCGLAVYFTLKESSNRRTEIVVRGRALQVPR